MGGCSDGCRSPFPFCLTRMHGVRFHSNQSPARGFSAVAYFLGAVGVGEAQTHVTSSAVFSPLTLELYTLRLKHSLIVCKARRLFCRMFVDAWIDQLELLSWLRCHTLHHTCARSSPRVTLTVCLKSGVSSKSIEPLFQRWICSLSFYATGRTFSQPLGDNDDDDDDDEWSSLLSEYLNSHTHLLLSYLSLLSSILMQVWIRKSEPVEQF